MLKHHHKGLKALQSEQGVVNQLPNHHGAPRGEEQTPIALRVQPGAQHEAARVQVPAAGAEAAAGARQRPGGAQGGCEVSGSFCAKKKAGNEQRFFKIHVSDTEVPSDLTAVSFRRASLKSEAL